MIVNNYIYNPKRAAMHYNLSSREWKGRPYATGQMVIVANVMKRGPDTNEGVPLFHFGGSGPLDLYMEDNLILNRDGERENPPLLVPSGDISKKCKVLKIPWAHWRTARALNCGSFRPTTVRNWQSINWTVHRFSMAWPSPMDGYMFR